MRGLRIGTTMSIGGWLLHERERIQLIALVWCGKTEYFNPSWCRKVLLYRRELVSVNISCVFRFSTPTTISDSPALGLARGALVDCIFGAIVPALLR